MPHDDAPALKKLGRIILHSSFALLVLLSSGWICMALWVQQPLGTLFSQLLIILWLIFACSVVGLYFSPWLSRKKDIVLYISGFLLACLWYFSLQPQQHRAWNPEVAHMLSYEREGNLIRLHNVRNFTWSSAENYQVDWQQRDINLDHITGVNILTSYWMGPQIAHTLVSFDFSDQEPLTFSIEIRKEQHENFSAIGGFFRQYELSLIAANEKDILFNRSHIRGEQLYLFPVKMTADMRKDLFLEYLKHADQLATQPQWYNTLSSNCTTLVFDMIQAVSKQQLPLDYRLIASGYLPNYLYDLKVLDGKWDLATWYQKAYINPHVIPFEITSTAYSQQIRAALKP